MKKKVDKHVFVCINSREDARKSCGEEWLKIRSQLASSAATLNSDISIRVNKSGCLGLCKMGPALVIYPQKIWYKNIKLSDCEEILEESILKDRVISRLEFKDFDLDD